MNNKHLASTWSLKLCCSPPTVKECVDNLNQEDDKEKLGSSLWGAERCLRVLESVSDGSKKITRSRQTRPHSASNSFVFAQVTVHNPENQSYLIAYKDSSLIISSAK